jgi:hypothetical protein
LLLTNIKYRIELLQLTSLVSLVVGGGDEYTATAEEMQDFRDFLAKMREHAPKK